MVSHVRRRFHSRPLSFALCLVHAALSVIRSSGEATSLPIPLLQSAASRALLQSSGDVTRVRVVDFSNISTTTDVLAQETELPGRITVTTSSKPVQYGAYYLGPSEVSQLNHTIATQLPLIPAARASWAERVPFPGIIIRGRSVQDSFSDVQPLRIPTVFAPFYAGAAFSLEGRLSPPGTTLHIANMTVMLANATYDTLETSGFMDFFNFGTSARLCITNSMVVLQSCAGFRDQSFHMWCCTKRQCNIQYTQQAIEDLGYPVDGDLELLSCHALVDPEEDAAAGEGESPSSGLDEGTSRLIGALAGVAGAVALGIIATCCILRNWRPRRKRTAQAPHVHDDSLTAHKPASLTSHSTAGNMSAVESAMPFKSPKGPSLMLETHTGTGAEVGAADSGWLSATIRPAMPGPDASVAKRKEYLDCQLDGLRGREVVDRLLVLDGLANRFHGGQAVVQVVEDSATREHFAAKFFLCQAAFEQEKRLYTDPDQPLGRFLPDVRCIADPSTCALVDTHGVPLPPCIVMEKGESLDTWAGSSGDGMDMVTALQVLTHVAQRVADLHEAGYVHRDIKPGNIMWLPRKKRWTLIDFGCVARTNVSAPTGFSLSFAAPEVVQAHVDGQDTVVVTEALDAWSVGIVAIELFTGQPAFDILQDRETTVEMIVGQRAAPWEGEGTAAAVTRRFGHLKRAVLGLLERDPAARLSMLELQHACRRVLSHTTTTDVGPSPDAYGPTQNGQWPQ